MHVIEYRSIKLLAEFVFKGKGTHTSVNAPEGMHY